MITSMSLERQKLISDEDFEETQFLLLELSIFGQKSKKKYGNNTIATIDL